MSRSLGRRSGAVLVLSALFAVLPASPASAEPVISIEAPRDGQAFEGASVSFSGSVSNNSPLHTVKDITLAVGDRSTKITCSDTPCPFSWRLTFPVNGSQQLRVTATEAVLLVGTAGGPPKTQTRSFTVAAPPARPVIDPPRVNDARNVELSWSRNTEGDMLYYAVFRRDPSGGEFRQVGGKVNQPATGAKVTFVDTTTSAFTGGDYAYRVVAVRRGASGTADTEAKSDASPAVAAVVPPPPTTSTAAPPPGSPAATAPGGPTTTAKPGPPAGVDLSGFLSSRSQPTPVAPITVPEPPDTGFAGTLPFGARSPNDLLEEGEEDAVEPGDGAFRSVFTRIDGGQPLIPIAAGLILMLLALHMRLLNRRIKVANDADLPVDGPEPARPVAVAREPEPEPEPVPPSPKARIYDVLVEEEGWGPEPEPEPDPVSLWAPPPIDEVEEDEELFDAEEFEFPDDLSGLDAFDEPERPEPEELEVLVVPEKPAEPEAFDELDDLDELDELEELEVLDEPQEFAVLVEPEELEELEEPEDLEVLVVPETLAEPEAIDELDELDEIDPFQELDVLVEPEEPVDAEEPVELDVFDVLVEPEDPEEPQEPEEFDVPYELDLLDDSHEPDDRHEPEIEEPEEIEVIEVIEVVSPTRRRLARAGSR